MKVLFDYQTPFALAHGGVQVQITRLKAALEQAGVEADYLRWWDAGQRADIIHFIGRPVPEYIALAHGHHRKVVLAELLTATGSRSRGQLALQRGLVRVLRKILPGMFTARLAWDSYRLADACVAITPWEAHLMTDLFGAPRERTHVVPNGVDDVFLAPTQALRGQWLVCAATITGRKRVLELAEAAVKARTPLWLVGKAYADTDSYAQRTFALVRQYPQILRHEGAIEDRARMAQIYREARGFVLLSRMETRSLSAEEAAACECPLLLADLPWARSVFGDAARYCPITPSTGRTAAALRDFYDAAPSLPPPPKPISWAQAARQLKSVYEGLLGS